MGHSVSFTATVLPEGEHKPPNLQIEVFLLHVYSVPSSIFFEQPWQAFFLKKSLWPMDGLTEVCLPFVILKLPVRGRKKKRKERWRGECF
jgi:hypothetical protein